MDQRDQAGAWLAPTIKSHQDAYSALVAPAELLRFSSETASSIAAEYQIFPSTISRISFPALKNGTFFGGTETVSPVFGFLPSLARR